MLLLELGPFFIFASTVIISYLVYHLSKIQDSETRISQDSRVNYVSLTSRAIRGLGKSPPDFSLIASIRGTERDRE